MQKRLTVTPERCSGCRTCEIACSIKHFNVINPKKSAIRVMVLYPNPIIRMPVMCSQCRIPKCAEVCPRGAIKTDEKGVVFIHAEECVGCQMCVKACPFGAIYLHEDLDTPFKCDLCGGDPECVKACANGALHFVPEHIFGQDHRMTNVLSYTKMKEIEYTLHGEKKQLRYTEIGDHKNDH